MLALVLTASIAAPGQADQKDKLKHRKHHVTSQIKGAKADLDEVSRTLIRATAALRKAQATLTAAQNHLAVTRGQLTAAKVLDAQMQAKLDDAVRRLDDAKRALAQGEAAVGDERSRAAQFVVQTYQGGDPTLTSLGVILSGQDPSQLTENLSLTSSMMNAEGATLGRLTAARTLLEVKKAEVAQITAEVARGRAEAARNLVTKQALEREAAAETAKVHQLVGQRRVAAAKARAARKVELHRIARLRSERRGLQRKIQRLIRRDRSPTIHRGGGYLSFPANGPITSPYGMRLNPIIHIWELHDGTDFGIPCGTPVYAAAAGRVISDYYNVAYGNRVLVNHGTVNGVNLVTIYNHLSKFVAMPGQWVHRGQLVAYSGTTGWSTGCHLHFMVLVNGVTVNPMTWL
ncbi:MAG: peptidoglycan DD-metalloendopeptidase family protein [Nocardioidaceae bacterium]